MSKVKKAVKAQFDSFIFNQSHRQATNKMSEEEISIAMNDPWIRRWIALEIKEKEEKKSNSNNDLEEGTEVAAAGTSAGLRFPTTLEELEDREQTQSETIPCGQFLSVILAFSIVIIMKMLVIKYE